VPCWEVDRNLSYTLCCDILSQHDVLQSCAMLLVI
jgi:hypothetical protein